MQIDIKKDFVVPVVSKCELIRDTFLQPLDQEIDSSYADLCDLHGADNAINLLFATRKFSKINLAIVGLLQSIAAHIGDLVQLAKSDDEALSDSLKMKCSEHIRYIGDSQIQQLMHYRAVQPLIQYFRSFRDMVDLPVHAADKINPIQDRWFDKDYEQINLAGFNNTFNEVCNLYRNKMPEISKQIEGSISGKEGFSKCLGFARAIKILNLKIQEMVVQGNIKAANEEVKHLTAIESGTTEFAITDPAGFNQELVKAKEKVTREESNLQTIVHELDKRGAKNLSTDFLEENNWVVDQELVTEMEKKGLMKVVSVNQGLNQDGEFGFGIEL